MSPMIGNMLLKQVMPRLRSVVRTIPKIGCEDDEEIIQDATLVPKSSTIGDNHPSLAGISRKPNAQKCPASP